MAIVPVGTLSLQIERQENRQEYIEELTRQLDEQIRYLVQRCLETALEEEVTAVLEREWYERSGNHSIQKSEAAECNRCHSSNVRKFSRNGHYSRRVDTRWGSIQIDMPQVGCECGGAVKIEYQTLRPYQRVWDDIEMEIRKQSGQGLSLRAIKDNLDMMLHSSVGLGTINNRLLSMADLVPIWHQQQAEIPPVVRVDGVWMTLMEATGKTQIDQLGRHRQVKTGQKRPILLAQGVWPAQRRQEILSWVIAPSEDTGSWLQLLHQLYAQGIHQDNGLQLLVGDGAPGLEAARQDLYWKEPFQRCVFHKLRNIYKALEAPETPNENGTRAYKRSLIRQAAAIWQSPDEEVARRHQRDLCTQWETEQPRAVATLRRDFELTLSFYQAQTEAAERGLDWPARSLRTTSPLERTIRTFRRRFRSALLFQSKKGMQATLYLICTRQRSIKVNALPNDWALDVQRQLSRLHPI